MNRLSLITLVLLVLSTSVFARKKASLGVVEFEIKDKKVEKISKHMYKYLREQVKKLASKKYTVVPAASMNLEDMYMMLACDSPNLSCMTAIAKMMKVNYLVYGTVSTQRNKYELVLKLLDVKSKKVKKGRLLGDLVSEEAMNKNIDAALMVMFGIKDKNVAKKPVRLLSVKTNNVISDVYLNEKNIGKTPLLLTTKDVNVGPYTLLIKKEGYEPIKKEIVLSENKIESVDIMLAKVIIPAIKKDNAKVATKIKDTNKIKGEETLDLTKNTKPIEKQDEWYKEWWVWGVAATVVTATVITIVLLSGDDSSTSTSNNNVIISF